MAINPLLIGVPIVAGGALYLILSKSSSPAYTPPPGQLATGPGGQRAQSYFSQIQTAMNAFRIASSAGTIFGQKTAVDAAKKQLAGTLDVVAGMSAQDAKLGVITPQDKATIDATIAAAKKEMAA